MGLAEGAEVTGAAVTGAKVEATEGAEEASASTARSAAASSEAREARMGNGAEKMCDQHAPHQRLASVPPLLNKNGDVLRAVGRAWWRVATSVGY